MKQLILVCAAVAALAAFGCREKTAAEKLQDAAAQAQKDAATQVDAAKKAAADVKLPEAPKAP